jgi:hypothetical protein
VNPEPFWKIRSQKVERLREVINATDVFNKLMDALKSLERGDTKHAYRLILNALPKIAIQVIVDAAKPRPFGNPIAFDQEARIERAAKYVNPDDVDIPMDLPLVGAIRIQNRSENVDKRDPMRLWKIKNLKTDEKSLCWARNRTQCLLIADILNWDGDIETILLEPPEDPTRIITEFL